MAQGAIEFKAYLANEGRKKMQDANMTALINSALNQDLILFLTPF